ncbi:MAG: carboxypeptidase-like regulatory domain-containing protein [Candidatus Brocadiales bacterium]|nr:carboxypeptidase-like regulatory domain-containing protein [Candidatus Brocadiales bacterium]
MTTDGAGNTGTDTITITYSITSTPTPQPTQEPGEKGSISGYVTDKRENPIEPAKIRLKGKNTKGLKKTISDEDGFFEFADLDADTYTITASKEGYKKWKKIIKLREGESTEIEIVMKKTSKRLQKFRRG